ncbi:MAG TPA: T9SS type A sorting domain-containing protein [bacterium]|nr:T9SS type A sorting domain-containing protein [bacterium]
MNWKLFLNILLISAIVIGNGWAVAPNASVFQKLDPYLGLMLEHPQVKPLLYRQALGKKVSAQARIPVLIKTELSRSDLNQFRVSVQSIVGNIVTASVSLETIPLLIEHPEIHYIQSAKTASIQNDRAISEIGAIQVHSGYQLTGKGVIVGIVDTGIDWQHDDFRNADGSTRIVALLDFSDPGDVDGDEVLDGSGPYGGTLYTSSQINSALSGAISVSANDVVGHGTHAAGSAAGNGRATGNNVPKYTYRGVAPEADLVIVKATRYQGSHSFVDVDYINAIAFIDSLASAQGKPYVVNLSLGGSNGPHDGTDLSEQAIDNIIGNGIRGKAIVVSSGNDGDRAIHSSGTFSAAKNEYEIDFTIPSYTANPESMDDYVVFEVWYDAAHSYRAKLITPSNKVYGPVSTGNDFGKTTDEGAIFISNARYGPSALNGDNQMQIQIYDHSSSSPPASGNWKIVLEGSAGRFDLWLAGSTMNAYLTSNVDYSMITGTPATAFNAITVGAYITKAKWTNLENRTLEIPDLVNRIGQASSFSSPGPTRDGRVKPEICAPGEMIASSYSTDAAPGTDYTIYNSPNPDFPNAFIARDGKHALSQGTSFSAPFVSGTIALLLQQNPNLDAIQIRDAIIRTATKDQFTNSVPNDKWGYGKLNSYQPVKYIIENPQGGNMSLSIFQNPALTQFIDFYLITRSPLQAAPTASIKIGSDTPTNISMIQLENLIYKGEYILTRSGTARLSVQAAIQGESPENLVKNFNVLLLKPQQETLFSYGYLNMKVPANAVSSNTYLTIFSESLNRHEPSDLIAVSPVFRINPVDFVFDVPLRLQFRYQSTASATIDETKIRLYRRSNENWVGIGGEVDVVRKTVAASITQLGEFALFYDPTDQSPTKPENFQLYQNYPNPFNNQTTITYFVPVDSDISLTIFNINGELIRTLKQGKQLAGLGRIVWDGKSDDNTTASSGIYFSRLNAGQFSTTRKMIFVK